MKPYVVKIALVPLDNLSWPPHARGRLLTDLSCGHKIYGLPHACPICKQEIAEVWHWHEAAARRYGAAMREPTVEVVG